MENGVCLLIDEKRSLLYVCAVYNENSKTRCMQINKKNFSIRSLVYLVFGIGELPRSYMIN